MTPEEAMDFARELSESGLENDLDAAVCVLANELHDERIVIEQLIREVKRLRAALQAIAKRAKGGTGAAVVVTPTMLGKIAEQALEEPTS